jgi:hypothetical protein
LAFIASPMFRNELGKVKRAFQYEHKIPLFAYSIFPFDYKVQSEYMYK